VPDTIGYIIQRDFTLALDYLGMHKIEPEVEIRMRRAMRIVAGAQWV
jgi:hypothetical protein